MPVIAYEVRSPSKKSKPAQYILIESSGPGNVPRNASTDLIRKAAVNLGKHLEPLSSVAETIRRSLFDINNPSEVEIEFGIELGGEAGLPTILSGSTKANFKVTIKWENKPKEAKAGEK